MASFVGKLKQGAVETLLSQSLGVLGHTSEGNYRRLVSVLSKVATNEQHQMIADWLSNWFAEGNPGAPWLYRVLHGLHPNVRKRFIAHTLADIFFRPSQAFEDYKAKYGIRPPSVMLVSPSMRCNYRCKGCYAGNYTQDDDLPFAVFDDVLTQAEKISLKFFVILGGEPFVYKPLLNIFEKHKDSPFQVYTNGSLIDKKMAKKLAELGNVAPQISLEGFEKETDARRGKGAFKRVMEAMDNLREAGCIFAFSVMVTPQNIDVVTSEEFIDLMIEKGALYGWYFLYMPVGREVDLSLMPSPEDRNKLRIAGKRFRATKPILLADFWNDAPLTGGCINGGRSYFHINSNGDVEPCIFVHFSTDNIKECSLVEALNSPFFRGLRKMHPFCYNTLRPCPVIDHPKVMQTAVRKYGARPTHEGAEDLLSGEIASALDKYSSRVKEIFDPVWDEEYAEWAEKWISVIDFPKERIETRKRGYYESRKKK